MRHWVRPFAVAPLIMATAATGAMLCASSASADNKRLNEYTYSGIYGAHQLNNCTNVDRIRRLRVLDDAARIHTLDVLNDRNLDGDIGSDGSTPQVRAASVGYRGVVGETVAINAALAISNLEVMTRWSTIRSRSGHAGLQVHRHRRVVGKQFGSHGCCRGVRTTGRPE